MQLGFTKLFRPFCEKWTTPLLLLSEQFNQRSPGMRTKQKSVALY